MENTKVFKKYHHTAQFNQILKHVREATTFIGLDENGEPMWDNTRELPTLKFTGTVKAHGANSSVVYDPLGRFIYPQSRNHIISVEEDNYDFAKYVEANKEYFISQLEKVWEKYAPKYNLQREDAVLTIYGEWCGEDIQKKSDMRNLPKTYILFSAQICSRDNPDKWDSALGVDKSFRYHLPDVVKGKELVNHDIRLYSVYEFQTFEVEVDCNVPEYASMKMSGLTLEVEEECPILKHFGFKGIGEGIVWSCYDHPPTNHPKYKDGAPYVFKVKGVKHSVTKVKTLAPIDIERLESTVKFVEYALTENRLNQGIEWMNEMKHPINVQNMGHFIKWCVGDVMREERDTIEESQLQDKEIVKHLSNKARKWFHEYLKTNTASE